MEKKTVSTGMLTLLLIGMLTLALSIQTVKAVSSTTVDIIHPQEGQFADYYMRFYAYPGDGWQLRISYNEYVQPHVINTTHSTEQPYESEEWCTVDTTNRLVTNTSPDFSYWNQTWYVLWIETDVTTGSTINWFDTTALVAGSQIMYVVGLYIDCWVAKTSYYANYVLSYYDKASGVMVAEQEFHDGELQVELILDGTNIPIGVPISLSELIRIIENWHLSKGIEKSLIAKLNVAQRLIDEGKIEEAKTILEKSFIRQVQNLTDIHIRPEAADVLIESAEYVLSHL